MQTFNSEVINFKFEHRDTIQVEDEYRCLYDVFVIDKMPSVKHELICGVVICQKIDKSMAYSFIESQWDAMSTHWVNVDVLTPDQTLAITTALREHAIGIL